MDWCCSLCSMCVPLVYIMLFSYYAVLLRLKLPPMIRLGICVILCSGGRYPLGILTLLDGCEYKNVDEIYVFVETCTDFEGL